MRGQPGRLSKVPRGLGIGGGKALQCQKAWSVSAGALLQNGQGLIGFRFCIERAASLTNHQ